jgi:hypothetical protein
LVSHRFDFFFFLGVLGFFFPAPTVPAARFLSLRMFIAFLDFFGGFFGDFGFGVGIAYPVCCVACGCGCCGTAAVGG